ncbi:helix-turn-helix transcriptional regulator [Pararhizobium haloflavum]|uniref:helix-turn-helix transcriptional regulator n=1 Tax=Pararhizobium haloflavum TaxID=2037914 RepID=UPI000C17AB62|nr:helix-turn-helix transcriptional regulator [Pararhizobium haloflavum]
MNMQINPGRVHNGAWALKHKAGAPGASDADEDMRSMAASIGATAHFVLHVGALASRSSNQTAVVVASSTSPCERMMAQLAPSLMSHMDEAILPLSGGRPDLAMLAGCVLALRPTKALEAALDGQEIIVFPVKLGGLGNGASVFVGDRLSLDCDRVLELHRKSYGVLKAHLAMALKKSAPRQNLNDRELECLQLAGEGLKSELIAERLTLSVHTVNAYLGTATAKLDSVNRIQAIAKAIRLGYLA